MCHNSQTRIEEICFITLCSILPKIRALQINLFWLPNRLDNWTYGWFKKLFCLFSCKNEKAYYKKNYPNKSITIKESINHFYITSWTIWLIINTPTTTKFRIFISYLGKKKMEHEEEEDKRIEDSLCTKIIHHI